jgi:hypothetical protein
MLVLVGQLLTKIIYKNRKGLLMTNNTESTDLKDMYKDTSCYTYEVTMLVQVLAPSKDIADAKLNQDGGYVSKRDVEFKHSTLLYKDGIDEETE